MNRIKVIFEKGNEKSKLLIDDMVIEFYDIEVVFNDDKTLIQKIIILNEDTSPIITINNRSDIWKFLDIIVPFKYYDNIQKIKEISSFKMNRNSVPFSKKEIEDILQRVIAFMEKNKETISSFGRKEGVYFANLEKLIYSVSGVLWNREKVEKYFDTIVQLILSGENKNLLYSKSCNYPCLISHIKMIENEFFS